jgi:hypothetical protein
LSLGGEQRGRRRGIGPVRSPESESQQEGRAQLEGEAE